MLDVQPDGFGPMEGVVAPQPREPQPVSFSRAETEDIAEAQSSEARLTHRDFIVGVDFGTTYSSVSVLCVPKGDAGDIAVRKDEIVNISNYPNAPSHHNESRVDVPTESWYTKRSPYCNPVYHDEVNDVDASDDAEASDDEGNNIVDSDTMDIDEVDDEEDERKSLYWGYEVRQAIRQHCEPNNLASPIHRFKLLLDRGELTRTIREELAPTVQTLKERKIIKGEIDLIADFLTKLFSHTKHQMRRQYQYEGTESIKFVLCIPAIWSQKACRVMQTAMTTALQRVEFITEAFHDVDNLLIVHEPEAAAFYVLAESRDIELGEAFVLLDAGGGTVDAVTYKVTSTLPLKLEREAGTPGGALCGSSYLNENFSRLIRDRLAGEYYLIDNGYPVERKIDFILEEFENRVKRTFNPREKRKIEVFMFDGLRENTEKKFRPHEMRVDINSTGKDPTKRWLRLWDLRKDMLSIFNPCLEQISRLMLQQIEQAEAHQVFVTKVLLIGGFAASPALEYHLRKELRQFSNRRNRQVGILAPRLRGAAVASGAVLWAMKNNEDDLEREIYCSYGLLRTEPYDPEFYPAHKSQSRRKRRDKYDNEFYIKNTIYWFFNKGKVIKPNDCETIIVTHYFPTRPSQKFLCEEILYVSDKNHESHYERGHEKNKGKILKARNEPIPSRLT
uniref:Hsp70-like protein n=1 Tax=Coccidioides posadasii RMSCC 3488 TaxID=454284 RepID=A0A0J6FR66_COCPO|nr:Hsp70-like protein [Coccidioides posadasii RMSCC 3488]